MSAFQLRSWDRRQLLNLLEHPHDAKQLRRAQALVWLHEGQPVPRVAELLRVEPRTLRFARLSWRFGKSLRDLFIQAGW